MKKVFYLLLILVLPFSTFSQDRSDEITRNKKSGLLDYQALGNGGMVLVHGYNGKSKPAPNWIVKSYAADLEARWTQEIKTRNANSVPKLVASSNGKTVFLMEGTEWDPFKGFSSFNLIRFDATGDFLMKEIGSSNLYNEELIAAFADENNMFILTASGVSSSAQYADLVVIASSDLSSQKIRLELPPKGAAGESKWLFAGCDSGRIFLYSTKVDEKTGICSHEVAEVAPDGKITRTFELEGSPDLKKFIQADHTIPVKNGSVGECPEFNEKVDPATQVKSYTENVHAFGQVRYSNKMFIVSGMWSSKPSKGIKDSWEGFFIRQYDDMGRKNWVFQTAFTGKLKEDKDFKSALPSASHESNVIDLGNGMYVYQVFHGMEIHSWALDEKGKLKTSDVETFLEKNNNYWVFSNPAAPASCTGFVENLDIKSLKDYSVLGLSSAEAGSILLLEDISAGKIYVYWFKG